MARNTSGGDVAVSVHPAVVAVRGAFVVRVTAKTSVVGTGSTRVTDVAGRVVISR